MNILGGKSWIQYQPLGVVGNISPWNFPFNLTLSPLADILSAGNRVMLKPSELTPSCSELIKKMITEYFDETEISVFLGGPEMGKLFSELKFDHLLFTGGTTIGKYVMQSAAKNLVPVTLELGGKSPVIIGQSADLKNAAIRVMTGKTMNAGQICLAPDYGFIHISQKKSFISHCKEAISTMYPNLSHNEDYTCIINQHHYNRLEDYLRECKDLKADIIEINPSNENVKNKNGFKCFPTLIVGI